MNTFKKHWEDMQKGQPGVLDSIKYSGYTIFRYKSSSGGISFKIDGLPDFFKTLDDAKTEVDRKNRKR